MSTVSPPSQKEKSSAVDGQEKKIPEIPKALNCI